MSLVINSLQPILLPLKQTNKQTNELKTEANSWREKEKHTLLPDIKVYIWQPGKLKRCAQVKAKGEQREQTCARLRWCWWWQTFDMNHDRAIVLSLFFLYLIRINSAWSESNLKLIVSRKTLRFLFVVFSLTCLKSPVKRTSADYELNQARHFHI